MTGAMPHSRTSSAGACATETAIDAAAWRSCAGSRTLRGCPPGENRVPAPRRVRRDGRAVSLLRRVSDVGLPPPRSRCRSMSRRSPRSPRRSTPPLTAVQPTPFQRDLSPTHTKRLAAKIDEAGAFLDPLIVVRGADGGLWTPNGRHRLAAAKVLGLRQITALVSPDESLAYRILAL